jgi:hypothetical protein
VGLCSIITADEFVGEHRKYLGNGVDRGGVLPRMIVKCRVLHFVFPAVILVAYSRHVIGWALDRTVSISRKGHPWDSAACESFRRVGLHQSPALLHQPVPSMRYSHLGSHGTALVLRVLKASLAYVTLGLADGSDKG